MDKPRMWKSNNGSLWAISHISFISNLRPPEPNDDYWDFSIVVGGNNESFVYRSFDVANKDYCGLVREFEGCPV